jgi:WD40 repeat protein
LTAALAGLAVAVVGGFAGIVWKWLEAAENYSQLAIAFAENELITEAVAGASGTIQVDKGTRFYFQPNKRGRWTKVITSHGEAGVRREGPPLPRGDGVICSDLSSDTRWRALAFADGTVSVRDAATGLSAMPVLRHPLPVNAVRFSPDSRVVATGSSDAMILIWEWRTGRLLAGPLGSDGNAITGLRFTLDGKHLVSLTASNALTVWNTGTWQWRSSRVVKLTPLNIYLER